VQQEMFPNLRTIGGAATMEEHLEFSTIFRLIKLSVVGVFILSLPRKLLLWRQYKSVSEEDTMGMLVQRLDEYTKRL
jgi:hypothetical protein